MQVSYDDKKDLLYFRLDAKTQQVINRRVSDNVVLDIGENDQIVGIEILSTSKIVNLNEVLPVKRVA